MCFHISQTKTSKELATRYQATHSILPSKEKELPFFYHANGFAHPVLTLLTQEAPRMLTTALWGIVPSGEDASSLHAYYKKAAAFGGGLNAQAEKLFTHFLYQRAAFTQKCLIPVTGFFEPHEATGKKIPYYITRKDKEAFSLAGIYSKVGSLITCSILTKEASPFFAQVHNIKKRQPVLVHQSMEQEWLQGQLQEKEILEVLETPYPEEELHYYPVFKSIFHPSQNSNIPEAIDPLV